MGLKMVTSFTHLLLMNESEESHDGNVRASLVEFYGSPFPISKSDMAYKSIFDKLEVKQ